jgi:mRNA interferase RelE/StbE
MGMKAIHYTETALKNLGKLGGVAAQKVMAKMEIYAENPLALANQVKKLKGSPYLRLRVGDYRVIFTEAGVVITVIKVGHRRDIYD